MKSYVSAPRSSAWARRSQILGPSAQLLNGSPDALEDGVFAHGSVAQRALLPQVVAGELILTYAVQEPDCRWSLDGIGLTGRLPRSLDTPINAQAGVANQIKRISESHSRESQAYRRLVSVATAQPRLAVLCV